MPSSTALSSPTLPPLIASPWSRLSGMAALLLCTAVLAGCSLPPLVDRPPSSAISEADAEQTRLGQALKPLQNQHPGESGIYPLAHAYDAYAARALLARAADRTLDVQYYIWRNDTTGHLLLNELLQAAQRGVRVRLLLDDGGTSGMDTLLSALDQHPLIEVRLFNPFAQRTPKFLGYLTDFSRTQRRMHNKGFTADGQASIVGGRNIGDEYFGATDGVLFADLDVMATGSVVPEVSREFDRYWSSASAYPVTLLLPRLPDYSIDKVHQFLHTEAERAEAQAYVQAVAQSRFSQDLLSGDLPLYWAESTLVSDDPAKVLSQAQPQDLLISQLPAAIGQAKSQLDLVSPYFVPTDAGVKAFAQLHQQGVRVRILTNSLEATDVAVVHAGYKVYREPLIAQGIELYEMRRQLDLRAPAAASVEATEQASAPGKKRLPSPTASHGGSGPGSAKGSGSSGASLHAKTFAVDGERLFVGSFNFDPRSAHLNTELGLVIKHPGLAQQVSGTLDQYLPQMAYHVQLNAQGQLSWTYQQPTPPHETLTTTTEPGSSFLQRLTLRILSWLPIEGFL